jgi:hypothetical protein
MTQSVPDRLKVLFIGNSFTSRNNLPQLVERLAAAAGKRLEHRLIAAGGASLRAHWNKGEAAREIQRGQYDSVVLQEQSTLPIKNARRMHENVRLFDECIKSAGSRTALYLTWARQHAPQTQAAITDAYLTIGREIGARVIPAGVAWENVLAADDPPALYDRDGSHPTLAGSYLAACVAFGVLFQSNPAGLRAEVGGLTPNEMHALQKAAKGVMTAKGKQRK